MPAPLAQPKMLIVPPFPSLFSVTSTTARATFIFVSVVMIAVAKSSACSGDVPTAAGRCGSAARIFSAGSGTPMMPVDDGMTSSKRSPNVSAVAVQISSQARMPGSPVAQFALPEFTTTAETRPPVAARCRFPDYHGRRDQVISRVHRSGIRPARSERNRYVQFSTRFDPRLDRAPPEPQRQRPNVPNFRHRSPSALLRNLCFPLSFQSAIERCSAELFLAASSTFATSRPASGVTSNGAVPWMASRTFA